MAMLNASGYTKIAQVLSTKVRERVECGSYLEAEYSLRAIESIAERLADLFERDSKNFDRQRFYDAIGIESIPTEEDQNGTRTG